MLVNYLHIYKDGANSVHVQATGDQFPTGYASGTLPASTEVLEECAGPLGKKSPSMRPGSLGRYLPCYIDDGDVYTEGGYAISSVTELVEALHPPSPTYSADMAAQVAECVRRAIAEGTAPEPKPEPAPVAKGVNAKVAEELAAAILAILNKFYS